MKKLFSKRLHCNAFNIVKVPITPKHFFRLIKSLYGIGKNVAKIFEFG